MENFNLGFFNQKKSDVSELAKKFDNLVITEDNLEEGKEAIKELKTQRIEITKIAKDVRADALAFQKGVLKLEKEVLAIIKPIEESLVLQKVMIDNKELLPERISKLKDINVEIEESILLKMNNVEFKKFYNSEQQKFLDEKVRIENEKKEEEKRQKELKEAEERAKKEAEERILEDKKTRYANSFGGDIPSDEILSLSDKEFNKIIEDKEEERRKEAEENARAEEKRVAEEKAKKEKVEAEIKEKEEKERAEKNQKYLDWKRENNVTKDDKIERQGNKFTLYRKVSSIVIE